MGPSWMVGWHDEAGWHGNGRVAAVTVTLPSNVGVPLVWYRRPSLNGEGGVCVMPRSRGGSGILRCPVPLLYCPFLQCVCCHSVVGLGWCLCVRVVSLLNSGGGLCWVEGRVVSTVHTPQHEWRVSQCDGGV